jgi:hypothetical protein
MAAVEIDREDWMGPQLLERRRGCSLGNPPAGVEIPASAFGIKEDVVADGPRCALGRHLVAPIGERHRTREPVAAVGPVGQVLERFRQPELEPLLLRMPADREVAEELAGSAVGAHEVPLGLPAGVPLRFREAGRVEVVTSPRQASSAATDRDVSVGDSLLDLGQPGVKDLEPPALGEVLVSGRVAAALPGSSANWQRKASFDAANA